MLLVRILKINQRMQLQYPEHVKGQDVLTVRLFIEEMSTKVLKLDKMTWITVRKVSREKSNKRFFT